MPYRTYTMKASNRKDALKMFRAKLLRDNNEVCGEKVTCSKSAKDSWEKGYVCTTYPHKKKSKRSRR